MGKPTIYTLAAVALLLLGLGARRRRRRSGELLDAHLAVINGMANDGHDAPAPDDDAGPGRMR